MKIVVTAVPKAGIEPSDLEMDERFGRAGAFVVFDTETRSYSVSDNTQNMNAVQGAGIQAAETVVRLGAECLITGHCGPKAFRTLTSGGIRVITGASGTVGSVISEFLSGRYAFAETPDVDGHW